MIGVSSPAVIVRNRLLPNDTRVMYAFAHPTSLKTERATLSSGPRSAGTGVASPAAPATNKSTINDSRRWCKYQLRESFARSVAINSEQSRLPRDHAIRF